MKHKRSQEIKTITRSEFKEIFEGKHPRDYTIPALLGIIIAGLILRFYNLGFNSLWLDEVATYQIVSGNLQHIWESMSDGKIGYSPPLFFVIEWVVVQIYGVSEASMRIVSAFFGTMTILVMYHIGEKFYDKTTGLITAAIIAFSPFLIFYSQEARMYSVLLFCCAVTFYFFLKAMKDNNRNDWIYFGIASATVLWTHFYAVIFPGLLIMFAIAYRRKELKNIGIATGIFAAVSLPIIITAITLYMARYASGSPTYGFRGIDVITSIFTQLGGYSSPTIYLSFFVAGIVWLYVKDNEKAFLLGWLVGAILLISVIMADHIPMIPRYVIYLMIPLSLGIAGSYKLFSSLVKNTTAKKVIAAFLITFFVIMALPFYQSYYTTYSKDDWRGISKDLTMFTEPGDTVVPVPSYIDIPLGFYYSTASDGTTMGTIDTAMNSSGSNTYFVMTSDVMAADPSGQVYAWMQEHTQIVKQYGSTYILRGI
jgi:mannosyltransferase